jgi:hypothetical protein
MRYIVLVAAILVTVTACSSQASDDSKHPVFGVPDYPGAAIEGQGVLLTGDSFSKVYAWYRQNLPAGSEQSHTTTPVESAVFRTGAQHSGEKSVTLTIEGDKTMIVVGSL